MVAATRAYTERPSAPEAAIQKSIVQFLAVAAPHVLTFAVPNASRRTIRGKASNAVAGLTPGIPDLCLVAGRGKMHFLEVKTPTGRLSPSQQAIRMTCIKRDIPFAVVTSIDDVRKALAHWGLETRESAA